MLWHNTIVHVPAPKKLNQPQQLPWSFSTLSFFQPPHKAKTHTPQTINMEPENRPSQKASSIPSIHFSGAMFISGRVTTKQSPPCFQAKVHEVFLRKVMFSWPADLRVFSKVFGAEFFFGGAPKTTNKTNLWMEEIRIKPGNSWDRNYLKKLVNAKISEPSTVSISKSHRTSDI